ncbi:MAG: PAS domain-containing protein, partial [Proteobacteria bacterium]|nr:PAS domain-containing protein [Pseudomonadota bacterium]
MNPKDKNIKYPNLSSVVGMLSDFQAGIYSNSLVIDKINETAKFFETKSQARTHAQIQTDKFLTLSLDLLCIAGPDATFKKVNPAFVRILGYSEEELLSKPFIDFIHPDDVAATLNEVEKLGAGQKTIHFENRYRAKDGSYRVFEWTTSPDPETGYLYAIARDLTEQKQSELETKQLSKRLKEAEFISKMGFWELDLETFQGKWTAGHCALFGLEATDAAPSFEMFMGFVHPEDRVKVQTEFARILERTVSNFELDFRILIDNGKTMRWMRESGAIDL